jgi:hypothetical protein
MEQDLQQPLGHVTIGRKLSPSSKGQSEHLQVLLKHHALVLATDVLRLDLPGIMPLPPWKWAGYERNASERAFIHIVRMVSQAAHQRQLPR